MRRIPKRANRESAHLEVIAPDPSHDSENPIDFIWQGIVGGLTRIIRNHPKDRFGTKAPLSGSFDDPAPEVMTTILNVFKNAFIRRSKASSPATTSSSPKSTPTNSRSVSS